MATNIYSCRESEIVKAHGRRDRKERATLQKELGAAIQRHLKWVEFCWDEHAELKDRMEYVARLPAKQVLRLYDSIHQLLRSLEEATAGGRMWPEDERGPHGFTMWYGFVE